jgi:hypothetical protein
MDITTFVTQYPDLGGLDHPQIRIRLPEFSQFFGAMESFPEDCSSPRSEAFPEGEIIPTYRPGLLGQESMTATFALFSQLPEDITDASTAIETLTVTLALPPDILSHTITSAVPAKAGSGEIYFGDTVTVTVSSSINAGSAVLMVPLPEAISLTSPDELKFCEIGEILSTDNSYRLPSEDEFMSACRMQWDGEWELDRVTDHSFVLAYADDGDNIGYPLILFIPALEAPTSEPDPTTPPTLEPTPPKIIIPPAPPTPTPPTPTPPTPTPPTPTPPTPEQTPDQKVITLEPVVAVAEKPITNSLVAKACIKAGVWIFTKNNLLQICDTELKIVLAIPACTGKKATPTYPWLFKAQRFKPGYSSTQSGQKLFYSVFFFKGLAIAGVEKVSSKPCSNGSVFIEKKYAKQVYDYIAKNKSLIWVKS